MSELTIDGIVELIGDKKFGFVRDDRPDIPKTDDDPFIPPPLIKKHRLRDGCVIEATGRRGKKGGLQVKNLRTINGVSVDEWRKFKGFDGGQTIYPQDRLMMSTGPRDVSMRLVELVAPIGKGQRALIVAPPRTGKTIMIKEMAKGISANHPEVVIVALLVDERPEEVTDFRRNVDAKVFASSNDRDEDNHVRVANLALEYCRRQVEMGRDVVMFLDSLTRLGRTFNLYMTGTGRTLSGGLDSKALNIPRRIFGSARNLEKGGSMTIIGTALIETGSRMDEVIFEEFKGTGNSEIVLDRKMADKRIFPAVNLRRSGTRNEDILLGDMTELHNRLFRALNSRTPMEATQALIRHIQQTTSNDDLLNSLVGD